MTQKKKDPNYSLENFEKALQPIIDKYIPLEKLKNAEHKRKYKPWITAGIRTSIKHRDKLLSSYTKEKNLSKKSEILHEYIAKRNSIVELIKKAN